MGALQGSEAGTPGPAGAGGETTENEEEDEDINQRELAIDGDMDMLDGDGASDDRDGSGGSRVVVVDEELAEPAAKRDPKAKKDRWVVRILVNKHPLILFQMHVLPESVHQPLQSDRPFAFAHRRKALPMQAVSLRVRPKLQTDSAYAHPWATGQGGV